MNKYSVARFAQNLPGQIRPIFLTSAYGLSAGAIAVAFQLSVGFFYNHTLLQLSQQSHSVFLAGSFAIVMSTALIVGWLLIQFCPDAAGSGIPQLKLAFWKDFGFVSWRIVAVKFIAGVLSIGGGSSLGREGPSVQLGGALASNTAGFLGEAKLKRRRAAAAGAAAGLAAAFNTPLAAITFVLEEIIEDLNSRILGSVILASVIGAFVVHGLVGPQPAFALRLVDAPTWVVYILTPIVAVAAALVGLLFQNSTLALRDTRSRFPQIPLWIRPAIGGLITWVVGCTIFLVTGQMGVFGLGYADLSSGLNLELGWKLAAVLLIAKLIATVTCYGFGGCGGIFSPLLFLGGMCGLVIAGLSGLLIHLAPADQLVLAVVGMSACLGSVVGAPVTGILIVFEMTHQFSLVPALMIGALISQAVSRKLSRHNFYEGILLQDGHHLEHVIPPRDLHSWQQMPVSAIANFHPVVIHDLSPLQLQVVLKSNPFQRFPVAQNGGLDGILTRKQAELAIAENRAPVLETAVACLPNQTVRELQSLLIESTSLIAILLDEPKGKILGVITLHDVLRAEVNVAQDSA